MEKNNAPAVNAWVAERLATLMPDSEFRPNTAWALAHFRALRNTKSRYGHLWGWTAAAISAALLCLFALSVPRMVTQRFLNFDYVALRQSARTPDRPEYAGGQLVRPVSYREWIYLSSGLGMEYNAAAGGS